MSIFLSLLSWHTEMERSRRAFLCSLCTTVLAHRHVCGHSPMTTGMKNNHFIRQIEDCVPDSPSEEIEWKKIVPIFAPTCFSQMKTTRQNPAFHGEGDVFTHTQMVCRELVSMPEFHKLQKRQRTELFLAAVLHDIGKVKTTRRRYGEWVSPHHSSTGSQIVREFLWRDCGLCGSPDLISFRETVCALVRSHMLPVHLMDRNHPERLVRKTAAIGELAPDFSWKLLCILAEADVRGRIADDIRAGVEKVQMACLMAEEAGCCETPYPFSDSYSKHAYLSGRNVQPDQILYDDTWGQVIMLSGLPGTGKDTWIQRNHPELPVLSLDDLRAELRISPHDNQGKLIQEARERARTYLRMKQPFIWNATSLTDKTREKNIALFERYGASVRIVYLETDWQMRVERNRKRTNAVPESKVGRMLAKTVPPAPDEAREVEWLCV